MGSRTGGEGRGKIRTNEEGSFLSGTYGLETPGVSRISDMMGENIMRKPLSFEK